MTISPTKNFKIQTFLRKQMNIVSIITSLSLLLCIFYFLSQKLAIIDNKFSILDDLTENTNVRNLVSLRKDLEEKKTFSNFGVSPTFQSFVAKKLDEIIEKYVINLTKKTISCPIN